MKKYSPVSKLEKIVHGTIVCVLTCVFIFVMMLHYTIGKKQDIQNRKFREVQEAKRQYRENVRNLYNELQKL